MATPNTSGAIARITREITNIQKDSDLSLAVACRDSDVRHVRALILGPPDTPYEFGFFEFDVKFGKEYPIKSPSVRCITTNSGRCRFNPNIYNCGKVCLSILGTWHGERGEEWSSVQGLESILLSIQSLLSPNPYENEPGHEEYKADEDQPKAYIAKIRHETIRIAVLQRLEGLLNIDDSKIPEVYRKIKERTEGLTSYSPPPPSYHAGDSTPNTEVSAQEYDAEAAFTALEAGQWNPFADLMKRRVLWYYDTYAKTIETASTQQPDGQPFKTMDFEGGLNGMPGQFGYKGLEKRLKRVAKALEDERKGWEKEGAAQVQREAQIAVQLAFQFKQLQYQWNKGEYSHSRMELSLPDPENPFVWDLTLFGKPMTNLDGGIFNIVLSIPPDFPEAQPRVKIETPIFHHHVATSGYLCYFPEKPDEIDSHLEAVVAAIEDENPSYDPRTVVSPGAFSLYWGGEEKRKFYNRKLRRSAQDSSEF